MSEQSSNNFHIRKARPDDVDYIMEFIKKLAVYEKMENEVVANKQNLRNNLFGEQSYAEVILACENEKPVGFALFFHNFSTFLGKPGIYLEDLFVLESHRGRGHGKALLTYLANLAIERDCGRLEWSVLNWNSPAITFYESIQAMPMDDWTVYRLTGNSLKNLAEEYGADKSI